ncbi:MAG: haloacid dehalogenase-like hydrolase [Bacteroidales bacterium]|nr:haloacid dehalogenase-like hydrolase [Bacteroidales bacterium]
MKKFWLAVSACILTLSCAPSLERGAWEEDTYRALASLLEDRDNRGGYAVFDCDNTSILHDVAHTMMLYQIENLAFAKAPEHGFTDGLPEVDAPLPGIGTSAREEGAALSRAYAALRARLDGGCPLWEIQADSLYLDFRARFLALYAAVGAHYDYGTLCLWEPSLAAGFSKEERERLGRASLHHWLSQGQVWEEEWVSPDGTRRGTAMKGLVVPDDMKALYRALSRAGIEPYICSASPEWLVEVLARECFGLDSSRVFGVRFQERADGSWAYDDQVPQPFLEGKVACIDRFIAPHHGGREPVLVGGDSEGDVAMLTAYPGMKMGLVMNHFRGGPIEALANAHDGRYFAQPVCINARQRIRQAFTELPSRAGGCYHSYEGVPGADTPAPKGYKPFYISHYGRHGSRYHTPKMLSRCYPRELERAAAQGLLTEEGIRVLERMKAVYQAHEGRVGDLSARGEREHRGIGRRMAQRFPEVFAGRDSVRAIATHYPRCQASMRAFIEGLGADASAVTADAGRQYFSLLCHEYIDQRALFDDVSDLQWAIRESRIDPAPLQERLFQDGFRPDSIQMVLKGIYIYGCQEEDLDFPEEGRLFDFFTPEELYGQWSVYSDVVYGEMGPSATFGDQVVPTAKGLLAQLLDTASEAVDAGSDVAADLRFGHDNGLSPLLALIGIEGYTERVPVAGSFLVWPSFDRIPMASNLQMVFYRKAGRPDILVKLLFNEREALIPGLDPAIGPYYRWETLETYLRGRTR